MAQHAGGLLYGFRVVKLDGEDTLLKFPVMHDPDVFDADPADRQYGGNGGDGRYVETSFGYGSNGCAAPGGSGGGGGGYYGGKTECREDGKGYGGSSFISNAFTNVSTIIGNNSGDGKARLQWYGDSL